MTNHWILQANPKMYDVDRAIRELEVIRWRTPQYTGSIASGDVVAIWRSGEEAGVVGVGRVLSLPGEMQPLGDEAEFERGARDESVTTMVPVAVAETEFVPKAAVAQLASWAAHPIIRAPMGTVFPVSPSQWAELAPFLGEVPEHRLSRQAELPPVFAWEQRTKDTYPMPGGYSGYVTTLQEIAQFVQDRPPNRAGLQEWMRSTFDLSESNARLGSGFLLRVGVLIEQGDLISLSDTARAWYTSGNVDYLVALLHSRIRFIGEMLKAAQEPKTVAELLSIANDDFEAGWTTTAQIQRRRGWLQSTGMLADIDGERLQTTERGRHLLAQITVQDPFGREHVPQPETTSSAPAEIETVDESAESDVEDLIARLYETGTDGAKHEQFEIETAEAFGRLGFRSQWLGKSGRTDVLLEAELGLGASYRVIVDCKSTSRGSVSNQIDWDTINEHRDQHQADFAVVLAPDFGGGRLTNRAATHETVLLKIDDLAELLRLHDRTPLTLDDYRLIFTTEDISNPTAAVAEIAEEAGRRLELVAAIIELLERRGPKMGPMTARDFFGALLDRDDLPDASADEIDELLVTLSSPLLGLLKRSADGSVRFATSPRTTATALQQLAKTLR